MPLAGVPFATKSLFDIEGHKMIAGSRARLETPAAIRDADAIVRVKRAGAVLIGITHMDQLVCGATGENPHFDAVRNTRGIDRMTGGSSRGSAAAVTAPCVPFGLGSDTNGSIRAPAALSGVWSIKPTFGRLSRQGCARLRRFVGNSVAHRALRIGQHARGRGLTNNSRTSIES